MFLSEDELHMIQRVEAEIAWHKMALPENEQPGQFIVDVLGMVELIKKLDEKLRLRGISHHERT